MIEIWKTLPEIKGFYEVSNLGRVKSLARVIDRKHGYPLPIKEKIMTNCLDKKGYARMRLSVNKIGMTIKVHRLVARAFIVNKHNKKQVNHKNGIKTDNNVNNLEWATNRENHIHAVDNNLIKYRKGNDHPMAILNSDKVLIIKERLFKGDTQLSIANDFGVNHSTICNIKTGRSWKNV